MEKRRKYKSLTVKRKLEVIERVESLPPGKKKKDIAAKFRIPQSTLSTILKDKEKLLVTCTTGNAKRKRYRESTKPEVDAALYQWFTAARADSIPISGEILKSKAEEFSTEFGVPEWSCSCGWISCWKERHNIAFRSVSGENASVDKSLCEDWRSLSYLGMILMMFSMLTKQVYTGVCFLTKLMHLEVNHAQVKRCQRKTDCACLCQHGWHGKVSTSYHRKV